MTPDEHYRRAEETLDDAEGAPLGDPRERYFLALAQVHATLATVDPQGKRAHEAIRARLLEQITADDAVDTFRRVWAEAGARGELGTRVRQALAAVVEEVLL